MRFAMWTLRAAKYCPILFSQFQRCVDRNSWASQRVGADDPGEIRRIDLLRVNRDDLADAESGEPLVDQRSRTAETDDAHLCVPQHRLAGGTEEEGLAVVSGIDLGRALAWRWVEPTMVEADDREVV